ncbi:MAG: transglutaminase domain protein [Frankiales bacterium]|nr:transglutaminase domain protein [Frankiales bacterium]
MRMQVTHTTTYSYDSEVVSSYNEARMVPQTGVRQTTLASTLTTAPDVPQHRYWDYWGTQVSAFDVHEPHTDLTVTCMSIIDTADAATPHDITWEDIKVVEDEHIELLTPSPRTQPDEDLKGIAAGFTGSPYEVVQAVCALVRERVAYVPGSTAVQTSAVEAWAQGAGVCQDIAHVTLTLLRTAGVPARYVSGYLHPAKEPVLGQTVPGESHAWVEVWLGDWWGFDPTNGVPAGERHVIVAYGRDYADVVPLKGVYAGGGEQSIAVAVDVTRLG